MLQAIIFDLDGTLIDSHKYIWPSFENLLGIKFSEEDIKYCLGLSLKDSIKLWEKKYGITGVNPAEFSRKSAEVELEMMKKDNHYNKDLFQLLNDSKDKGIKMAVATSSTRWRAESMIADILNIRKYLETIITADDVENHKPNPDLFLKAAKLMQVSPAECVVFEDATSGIEAAKRAGIKSVAKKTEYHTYEELKDADIIIDNFSEINLNKLYDLINHH